MSNRNSEEVTESGWYTRKTTSQGLRVVDTLEEVKNFAYKCFDALDKDSDGFVSRQELNEALTDPGWDWRDRSYVCFLLRRLDDIKGSYPDEWGGDHIDGVSRADIQEYFKSIRSKIPGSK